VTRSVGRARPAALAVARVAPIALAAALGLVACGSAVPTGAPAVRSVEPAPVATSSAGSPAASAPSSHGLASGMATAREDPSLLGVLPATVGGVPVILEHQSFVDAVADPAFASNTASAAFGVAVSGSDLVSGVVARLVPGRYSEAFFRDWRDTYDAGACAQSGGVAGNAQTTLGGRTVYIGTCAGGLRTYHAWVPSRGAIVSLFSVGDARLGEQAMSGIRP
jgi:hypothetical protein